MRNRMEIQFLYSITIILVFLIVLEERPLRGPGTPPAIEH